MHVNLQIDRVQMDFCYQGLATGSEQPALPQTAVAHSVTERVLEFFFVNGIELNEFAQSPLFTQCLLLEQLLCFWFLQKTPHSPSPVLLGRAPQPSQETREVFCWSQGLFRCETHNSAGNVIRTVNYFMHALVNLDISCTCARHN